MECLYPEKGLHWLLHDRYTHTHRYLRYRSRRIGKEVAEPQEVYALRGKGIVDIVSGGWSFHALDRNGYVWFWGIVK